VKNKRICPEWVIRVSSELEVGAGHIMRCLSIAKALEDKLHTVHFIIDSNTLKWKKYLTDCGISNSFVNEVEFIDCEFFGCIIDGYQFNQSDYKHWKMRCKHLVVIDDYGDAPDYSSVIISPSLQSHPLSKKPIKILLGSSYALLSQEYAINRIKKYNSSRVKTVLVSCGIRDGNNYNALSLKLLQQVKYQGSAIVAVGPDAPHIKTLKDKLSEYDFHAKIVTSADGLYEILKNVDLVIGSGGVSLLERMSLGIPSLTFITADNQTTQVLMAEAIGGTVSARLDDKLGSSEVLIVLDDLLNNKKYRDSMSKNAKNYIDGQGVWRVVNELVTLPV